MSTPPNKIDNSTRQKAYDAYLKGDKTKKEICSTFSMSERTLRRIIQEGNNGLYNNATNAKVHHATSNVIKEKVDEGEVQPSFGFVCTQGELIITKSTGQNVKLPSSDSRYAQFMSFVSIGQMTQEKMEEFFLELSFGTKQNNSPLIEIDDNIFGNTETGETYIKLPEGDVSLPKSLSMRLIECYNDNHNVQRFCRFARMLAENPSSESVQSLYDFMEKNNSIYIDDQGFVVTYKYVTSDYKDNYSKTFDNSVGAIQKMPRNMVDDNRNNGCGRGFHAGSYEYASRSGPNLKTMKVVINPKDVVSVPYDCSFQKVRVCEYKVVDEVS